MGNSFDYSWENRHQYVEAIRRLRLLELTNPSRLQALKAGLASILPLQLMTIMSPYDVELRTCGLPYVDIEFLKASFYLCPFDNIWRYKLKYLKGLLSDPNPNVSNVPCMLHIISSIY